MARVAMAKSQNELPETAAPGPDAIPRRQPDVACWSQLQLDGEVLQRLGQKSASAAIPAEAPDFVFHTGCNVLKNPSISRCLPSISWMRSGYLPGDGRAKPLRGIKR